MADEPDNLVLRYLRRLDEKVDRVIADIGEVKVRLSSMEARLTGLEASVVPTSASTASSVEWTASKDGLRGSSAGSTWSTHLLRDRRPGRPSHQLLPADRTGRRGKRVCQLDNEWLVCDGTCAGYAKTATRMAPLREAYRKRKAELRVRMADR